MAERARLGLALLAMALFASMHLYLLAGPAAVPRTGVMSPAFLEFLPTADAFIGSARELARQLPIGFAVIVISIGKVFRMVWHTMLTASCPWRLLMLTAAAGSLTLLTRHCLPATISLSRREHPLQRRNARDWPRSWRIPGNG